MDQSPFHFLACAIRRRKEWVSRRRSGAVALAETGGSQISIEDMEGETEKHGDSKSDLDTDESDGE
jgi:hypothetical protein